MRRIASHLSALEAESIHLLREVAAEFERPVLLFSGGKDSVVMAHTAAKAFWPAKLPFPVMHVDTGHNFPEVIAFRDAAVERLGARLVVASVQDSIDQGRVVEDMRIGASRNRLQTTTLLDAIEQHGFDAVMGGARRDEEKSRAKERFFSFRDQFGQWDPKNQRPELWNLYNARVNPGESIRVFPLSNWTELDVWQYIYLEQIPVNPLYFAKPREAVVRNGQVIVLDHVFGRGQRYGPSANEQVEQILCRFRSLGCVPCSGAIRSTASSVEEIVEEMMVARTSE